MRGTALINPVIVCKPGSRQRLKDRAMPAILRGFALISTIVLGGRAIGLACTLVARLLGDGGTISFRLADGSIFTTNVTDRYWLYYLLLRQEYEPDIDLFLGKALKPQDSFLDCGANLGLWSIAAARIIKSRASIIAVEASSRTFALLKNNWERNGRTFTTCHRAIGIRTGELLSFFSSTADHASATLVENLSPADAEAEKVTTVSVLDLLADQRNRKDNPDALIFIKLDVEGMERDILSTLGPLSNRDIIIIYEDHGSERNHVTQKVLELGYSAVFLGDDGTFEPITSDCLSRLGEIKSEAAKGYNFLAFAPKGAAANRVNSIVYA